MRSIKLLSICTLFIKFINTLVARRFKAHFVLYVMSLLIKVFILAILSRKGLFHADVVESVEYCNQNLMADRSKRCDKIMLKPCKNSSESNQDTAIANSPFDKIKWDEFESESSPKLIQQKDDLPVLEASKKYGLPSVIEKCVTRGDIALSFDDGVSRVTQEVLNILRKARVKATFFVLGNTLDSPILGEDFAKKVLTQMIEDGHVIASHSYSHPNFDDYWPEGIQHEMNRAKGLFQKHISRSPRFMRPPFGNASPRTIKALNDLGYFIIRWNVDTNDWMHKYAPEKSLREFSSKLPEQEKINSVRWQKGGLTDLGVRTVINGILDSKIALMHDIHSGITGFLPQLIQHARNLGYRFVSMDECLGGINPYFEERK